MLPAIAGVFIEAKGLPIFFIEKNDKNIAVIEREDLNELETYLQELNYEIYLTDSITFEVGQEIKIATTLDNNYAFDFVIKNDENRTKLLAYTTILEQYGEDYITTSLKRQIWKDVVYNASDYYIYYNNSWYIFNIETQDVICPVSASVDYICETMKAYYRTSNSV